MTFSKAVDEAIRERFPDDVDDATAAFALWLVDQFTTVAAEAHAKETHERNLRHQHARILLEKAQAEHPDFKQKKAVGFYNDLIKELDS